MKRYLTRLLAAFKGARTAMIRATRTLVVLLLLDANVTFAQYQPVPNFIGVGAGQQFRQAINNRLSGVTPIAPAIVTIFYAQLPAEVNGAIFYLRDGTAGVPCAGGGTGAFAIGINGQWSCTAGAPPGSAGTVGNPLSATLNFNSFKGTNAAVDTTTGNVLSHGQSTLDSLAVPTASVPLNSQRLTGAGTDTTTGDVLSRGQSTFNSLASPSASVPMNSQVLTGVGYGQQFAARQTGAVVVSSTSTSTSAQITGITLTAPASIVNGNALVALLSLNGNNSQAITAPTGFNAITAQVNNSSNLIQIAYCKIAASESGNYAFGWTNAAYFLGGIVQLSGVSSCTPDAVSSAVSAGATSLSIPGAAATQTNDVVLTWASLGAGGAVIVARGTSIFGPNGNSNATYYLDSAGTSPAVSVSATTNAGMVGQQIAFASSSTLTQTLVLQGGAGNVLQDLSAHVNGVLDVKAPPYNAGCDGTTDDSAAIQKALNDGCTQKKAVELPSGTCRTTMPLFDACANPATFFGRSESSSILSAYFNGGPVLAETNPANDVTDVGPITATSHLGGGVALCWNGAGTPCGTATGSDPGLYTYDVKDWTDNGNATNPLNGLTAGNLTVQFEGFIPTGAAGAYLTDSGSRVTGAASHDLFIEVDGGNHLSCYLNTGGTVNEVTGSGWTFNAWHHGACVYDNHSGNSCATTSCLRLYLDGTQINAADVTGSVVQPTYDSWVLGGDAPHFPGSGYNTGLWDGMVDYFDVEKADLYPSGTAFTPPTSKPTANSNQIVLVNGDVPATISGFGSTIAANGVVGADNAAGDENNNLAQLPGIPCDNGKCGTWAYIHDNALAAGGTASHRVHDMTILNGGESIMGNVAVQFHARNLTLTAWHVPFKFFNNSYEMMADNIVATTNGEAAMELAHNSGFVMASGVQLNNGTAGELACFDQACGAFTGLMMNPQLGLALFNVYFGEDSTFTNFSCTGCLVDSENAAPTIATGWFEGGEPTLIGGDWQSLAPGSPPSIQLTAGTTLSAFGTHFEGGTANSPVFHWLTAPTATSPHIRLDNVTLNGAPPYNQGDEISDQPNFVDVIGGPFAAYTGYSGFRNGVDKLTVNYLADPAAPSISVVGATGSTTYGPYYVVCRGIGGSTTNASGSSNTVTNGAATLTSSNYIQVTWTTEPGCASWDVLKGSLTTSIATGLNASATSFNDTGGSTSAYTQPPRNTTGDVKASYIISSGTTFALLPATAVNGARIYCSNCDPPANPPVACTSSGARTGAMAEGINGSWYCAY